MNTIELIKDAAFFGGNIPSERLKECKDLFDKLIEDTGKNYDFVNFLKKTRFKRSSD